jgi:hypothetical protein
MKSWTAATVLLAAGFFGCAPAFAQTTPDTATSRTPTGQKQATQGLPASSVPPEYGSPATAKKQATQGLPAGSVPPEYGSDWARAQKQQ